jgi:hypothetical protein
MVGVAAALPFARGNYGDAQGPSEVEDSVKCSHDYRAGSSAHVQCAAQLDAARTQGPPRAQLDTKGTRLRDTVTSTVAGVGAAMAMLIL